MPVSRTKATTPWFIKNVMNPVFKLTGAFPLLTVHGRQSGKPFTTPINVLDMGGAKYLVSPRGETGWSRNARAVGEVSLKIKGEERRYRAIEVPVEDRPTVIAAYMDRWRNQTRGQFAKLPDPVDHPTFRLEPI